MILFHKRLPGGASSRVWFSFFGISTALQPANLAYLEEITFYGRNTEPGLVAVECTLRANATAIVQATNGTIRDILHTGSIVWVGEDALFICSNIQNILKIAEGRLT